jgi:hypothetical protein
MPTTNGNRKILDLKRWEFCAPSITAHGGGVFHEACRHVKQMVLGVFSTTNAQMYFPEEDAHMVLPNPALATFGNPSNSAAQGSFSTGTTVAASSLTATGGTTSTIVTNQTLATNLRGYSVHILAGPNAGATLTIVSNTIGANATITVAAQASAFSASTVYRLVTPVWYVLGAGTLASGSFKKYDFATNTWTTLANTGLPASFLGTDGRLVSTPSWIDSGYLAFGSGTATSGTGTTLVQTGKTWTVNQWTNSQVRIVSGTGAGQIRTISSNTADTLTVPTWTTTPDATSVYQITGNDDFLYLMGNSAVTMYRYSISGNTWTTLSPVAARGGATGSGMSGSWVNAATESNWTNESAILNGRYIFSFRGGAASNIDRYDIAGNTWAAVTYAPAGETFTGGSKYAYAENFIYAQKDATGRWLRYDVTKNLIEPWSVMLYPQGTANQGNTAFNVTYFDGATRIEYVYMQLNGSTVLLRQMVI